MSEMSNRYLDQLRRELRRLPAEDREDAVREIGSHIADAEVAGQPQAAVLAKLGTPKDLARAYIADAYLQEGASRRGLAFMGVVAFVAGSGMVSVIVVPLLTVTAITFGLTAVASPVIGVLQLVGVISDANGVVYWGEPVAKVWVLPLTLVTAILCAAIAWGSWRALRWYSLRVLSGYQRVRDALAS
jgi:uncharacterized membrane protein